MYIVQLGLNSGKCEHQNMFETSTIYVSIDNPKVASKAVVLAILTRQRSLVVILVLRS